MFNLRRRKSRHFTGTPFLRVSQLGREFLIAADACFEFMKWLDGSDGVGGRPALNQEFDPEFREKMQALIAYFERLDEVLDLHAKQEKPVRRSPNAKGWLHDAVFRIHRIWAEAGQEGRTKKDFEMFAYNVLEGTRAVTPEGIKESMDRHVRPRLSAIAAKGI